MIISLENYCVKMNQIFARYRLKHTQICSVLYFKILNVNSKKMQKIMLCLEAAVAWKHKPFSHAIDSHQTSIELRTTNRFLLPTLLHQPYCSVSSRLTIHRQLRSKHYVLACFANNSRMVKFELEH